MQQDKTQRLVRYPIYTMGDLGSGIYSVLPSILLMFYMTNILGVPVPLATLAAFVPKVIDLLASPIVGGLSDRTRTKLGRRRPWILAGSLSILPTFALIWIAPFPDPSHSAWFVLGMFSLCTIGFSCFVIPFFALNTELPRTYHERTALNAWRTAYTFAGCILAGAGAPLIAQLAGGGRHGYMIMGLAMGTVMALVTFVTFLASREPPRDADEAVPTLRQTVQAIAGNGPFKLLLGGYFLHITSVGLGGAVLAYFVTYVLHRDEGFLALMFLLTYGSAILAIPAWSWVSTLIGKLASLQVCLTCVALSGALYALASRNTATPWLLALAAFQGLNGAAVQVFIFSMLGDCIQHGNRRPEALTSAAVLNGVFISGEKLGFATGALLSGLIFAATGLVATTHGATAQPQSAISGIHAAISWAPAALNLAAIGIISFYRAFERGLLATQAQPA